MEDGSLSCFSTQVNMAPASPRVPPNPPILMTVLCWRHFFFFRRAHPLWSRLIFPVIPLPQLPEELGLWVLTTVSSSPILKIKEVRPRELKEVAWVVGVFFHLPCEWVFSF